MRSIRAPLRVRVRHFARVPRKPLHAAGIAIGTFLLASTAAAGQPNAVDDLVLEKAETWAPRAEAAPVVSQSKGEEVTIRGNGSRLCCGGRPRVPDRQAMDGIFFVLRTGREWNALNATGLCSSSTAHLRFQAWTAAGVFRKLWAMSLESYDELKGLDWSWQSMDGAMTKAPLGGGENRPQSHGSGKERRQTKPADRGVRGAHRAGD